MPLYTAAERPVLERDGMLMMVDDDRIDPARRGHQKGWCASVHLAVGRSPGRWNPTRKRLRKLSKRCGFLPPASGRGGMIDRDQAGSMELKNVGGISEAAMNAMPHEIANEGGVEARMELLTTQSLLRFNLLAALMTVKYADRSFAAYHHVL